MGAFEDSITVLICKLPSLRGTGTVFEPLWLSITTTPVEETSMSDATPVKGRLTE